jgi:sulfite reductase (NADPH) flavoprotein alpha-component
MMVLAVEQNTQQTSPLAPAPFSRNNPYMASVLQTYNLNGKSSRKETRHIVLSLKGSGLGYAPGDCLGIIPSNDPELAEAILAEMKWDRDEEIIINKNGEKMPVGIALTNYFEITLLTKKIMQSAADLTENSQLKELVNAENAAQLKDYIQGRDLLDMLRDFGPWSTSAQNVVALLRKMPPRLYSIASSLNAHPDEVHLTIGAVRYRAHGRERKGTCSVLCAERLEIGDKLPVFVQPNNHFKLPQSKDAEIIMVGPGTGIAPFRSFIQERAAAASAGKSWLFFGDQHSATDFLYQTELEQYWKKGVLTRLDAAFSRDTDQKVYVQHKMLENSKELFAWLEKGACFYVCGDKQNMAKDVHNTLLDIIGKEGSMTRKEAEEYLLSLQKEKRYQRDVY